MPGEERLEAALPAEGALECTAGDPARVSPLEPAEPADGLHLSAGEARHDPHVRLQRPVAEPQR
jgi:hypothetical protein